MSTCHCLKDVAKLRWLDDINVIVNKSLAPAKPELGVSPVDPIAAANVDEDLDYRIATEPQNKTHWSVSSRSLQSRRHANRGRPLSLPPILLALLGKQPRSSTAFRRAQTSAGLGRGGSGGRARQAVVAAD